MLNRQRIDTQPKMSKEEARANFKMVGMFSSGTITAQLLIHGVQGGVKQTASRLGYTTLIGTVVGGLGMMVCEKLGVKAATGEDRIETGLRRIGMFSAGACTLEAIINGNQGGFKATTNRLAGMFLMATSIGSLGMAAFTFAEIYSLQNSIEGQQANRRSLK